MAKPSARDRILDAAVQTLHERGFNGCGVQDITDAAGVPKGSFYSHFDSKEALGAAALDRYWEDRSCALLRGLSDDRLPPLARLRRYFRQLRESLAERDYARGCLIGNLSAELSDQSRVVCDRLSSVFAGWTRAVQCCVRDGQRAGEIRTDIDSAVLAGFLVSAWEGAVLRARVDKDGTALVQFEEVAFHVIAT
jgi:TetR/AcrR family transcriptional regulator, transcriptional repressor for nem operon